MIKAGDADEDDIFDETLEPNFAFKRGVAGNRSAVGRLSNALRRSLRLPSRDSPVQFNREELRWQRLMLNNENLPRFTDNSPTLIGPSSKPWRLDEIKENRRLNRTEKVKKIVRKADWPIRHEVRKELWRELCRGKDFDSSRSLFRGQLDELVVSGKRTHNPQFLNEEGVVINNFELNEHGSMRLLRLLKVVENLRPEISCAPMLYPLCALMLHYLDETDVFACVNQLLSNKGYLMTSPVEWAASSHTLLALIKKYKASTYAMLKRRCGTADDVVLVKAMRDWLSWIFHALPLSYVVRIVDCYLVEGHKFIIRAAISIVYIWAKGQKSTSHLEDLSGKSLDERVDHIKNELALTAQHMQISTDTFIETCVGIRNLQSAVISRFQLHYEDKVRDEVHRQQSLKRNRGGRASKRLFTQAFESAIVDTEVAAEIMTFLPARLQLATPSLLFRLSQDGASFTKLWNKIDIAEQSLLIIRTTDNEIFGAYCSSSWAERNDRRERTKSKYFGTGESFVWRIDQESEMPVFYGWVGNNNDNPDKCPQMFMTANEKMLVIGSGDGDAIRIADELTQGITSASKTFGSPALVSARSFDIHELEVFDVLTGT